MIEPLHVERGDVTEQHKTSGVAVGCSHENPSPRCDPPIHRFYDHCRRCACGAKTLGQ